MKKLTPSELGIRLFKRQVEDDTLSQAMSRCSLNGPPSDLEHGKASQPIEQISESSQRSNPYMNPFYSSIFLSAVGKSSNALVTFAERICFGCSKKGHYVNKCPQRCPKDPPTEIGTVTTQSIQHSKNVHISIVGSQKVQGSQTAQNSAQTPPNQKYYNYGEKGHYFNECPNPCIHLPSALPLWPEWSLCPPVSRSTPTTDSS
jgi:hypothetical protein